MMKTTRILVAAALLTMSGAAAADMDREAEQLCLDLAQGAMTAFLPVASELAGAPLKTTLDPLIGDWITGRREEPALATYEDRPDQVRLRPSFCGLPRARQYEVIAHELGHAIDQALGRLEKMTQRAPALKTLTGRKISENLLPGPHDSRPWEISADQWQAKILERLPARQAIKVGEKSRYQAITDRRFACGATARAVLDGLPGGDKVPLDQEAGGKLPIPGAPLQAWTGGNLKYFAEDNTARLDAGFCGLTPEGQTQAAEKAIRDFEGAQHQEVAING